MKRFLLLMFFISLFILPAYCEQYVYEIYDENDYTEENTEEEITENSDTDVIETEKDNKAERKKTGSIIYFDIDKHEKMYTAEKIFKLNVERNDEFLEHKMKENHINIETAHTKTDIFQSKFNNKTTISSKTMIQSDLLSPNFSFGYGSDIKEYMPLPDTTNFSTLSASFYTDYKFKNLIFESELEHTKNIATDTSMNYFSFGPKINLTKSTSIKSSITKEFSSNNIYGEIALIYKPVKSKHDSYFEINAWSNSTQYNIPQQRLQIYGKIKI